MCQFSLFFCSGRFASNGGIKRRNSEGRYTPDIHAYHRLFNICGIFARNLCSKRNGKLMQKQKKTQHIKKRIINHHIRSDLAFGRFALCFALHFSIFDRAQVVFLLLSHTLYLAAAAVRQFPLVSECRHFPFTFHMRVSRAKFMTDTFS